jgi:hypothetical protein
MNGATPPATMGMKHTGRRILVNKVQGYPRFLRLLDKKLHLVKIHIRKSMNRRTSNGGRASLTNLASEAVSVERKEKLSELESVANFHRVLEFL